MSSWISKVFEYFSKGETNYLKMMGYEKPEERKSFKLHNNKFWSLESLVFIVVGLTIILIFLILFS